LISNNLENQLVIECLKYCITRFWIGYMPYPSKQNTWCEWKILSVSSEIVWTSTWLCPGDHGKTYITCSSCLFSQNVTNRKPCSDSYNPITSFVFFSLQLRFSGEFMVRTEMGLVLAGYIVGHSHHIYDIRYQH